MIAMTSSHPPPNAPQAYVSIQSVEYMIAEVRQCTSVQSSKIHIISNCIAAEIIRVAKWRYINVLATSTKLYHFLLLRRPRRSKPQPAALTASDSIEENNPMVLPVLTLYNTVNRKARA